MIALLEQLATERRDGTERASVLNIKLPLFLCHFVLYYSRS
jgi:hypothetical protein